MSDVSTILLVPSDAHREALLGDGVCGARVPFLRVLRGSEWVSALVLAYRGEVVREGCLRAMVVGDLTSHERLILPYQRPTIVDAEEFAWVCASWGLGTIVLLDADGREVTRG